jgi:hypothetical protein
LDARVLASELAAVLIELQIVEAQHTLARPGLGDGLAAQQGS